MQTVSQNYKDIIAQGGYKVETKLLVNGTEFPCMSISVNVGLFSGGTPMAGSCVSGEIDADIIALSADIPRMAKLEPYIRLTKGNTHSEWLRKGIYYIDTRREDTTTGILTVHGYDALMKAEQSFTAADMNSWGTKTDAAVVNLIASRIGVTLDSRTQLGKAYTIPNPNTGNSAETMREMLGYIGAAYGGNWIITFDGKLLLCKLNDIPEETYLLCNEVGSAIVIGGDRIVLR